MLVIVFAISIIVNTICAIISFILGKKTDGFVAIGFANSSLAFLLFYQLVYLGETPIESNIIISRYVIGFVALNYLTFAIVKVIENSNIVNRQKIRTWIKGHFLRS